MSSRAFLLILIHWYHCRFVACCVPPFSIGNMLGRDVATQHAWCSSLSSIARGLVERRARAAGELELTVVGPEVHEEQTVSTKSPVIAALPSPVGWKPIPVAKPSRPGGVSAMPSSVT